ncbi:MAG: glycosyltransferase family 4 protein [Opitutales bacterium]
MRILIHDFGGYPFVVEAAQELARRGHEVCLTYVSLVQPEREDLTKHAGDRLEVQRLTLPEGYAEDKYRFGRRFWHEVKYARTAASAAKAWKPEVIFSGNAPTHLQSALHRAAREIGARFVPWVQDFYSNAVDQLLRQKLPVAGGLAGTAFQMWERHLMRSSDAIIIISPDFQPMLEQWAVDSARIRVIENWAPIESIPQRSKDNAWARQHELHNKFCLLYAGTMGLKHNPELLAQLARAYQNDPDVRVVVVAEGKGADHLRDLQLPNLVVLPMQAQEHYADVLATGDVLVALLEPDAAVFSVPSKVLSYLCAARPLLLAVPPENLAARIVSGNHAGEVAAPSDTEAFLRAAHRLRSDPTSHEHQAACARAYAEEHFRPHAIGERFEEVLGILGAQEPTHSANTRSAAGA